LVEDVAHTQLHLPARTDGGYVGAVGGSQGLASRGSGRVRHVLVLESGPALSVVALESQRAGVVLELVGGAGYRAVGEHDFILAFGHVHQVVAVHVVAVHVAAVGIGEAARRSAFVEHRYVGGQVVQVLEAVGQRGNNAARHHKLRVAQHVSIRVAR
nr:hypothetical protein [Tanacetum cinerariifolium]